MPLVGKHVKNLPSDKRSKDALHTDTHTCAHKNQVRRVDDYMRLHKSYITRLQRAILGPRFSLTVSHMHLTGNSKFEVSNFS